MDDYARRKVEPFQAYVGAALRGVKLLDENGGEPNLLVLSFEGLPDLEISVWHGMGASGFDIETADAGGMQTTDGLGG